VRRAEKLRHESTAPPNWGEGRRRVSEDGKMGVVTSRIATLVLPSGIRGVKDLAHTLNIDGHS
jgi:hypothetical protein